MTTTCAECSLEADTLVVTGFYVERKTGATVNTTDPLCHGHYMERVNE
jgi:hypothetical protein